MAKILMVDDSKFMRDRVKKTLLAVGHEVVEASDGAAGLEMVLTHDLDCVLLDLNMPVLDGIEFLGRLRTAGSHLPVIVLTADIQTATENLCQSLGVSGFLPKPPRSEDLYRTIEDALASCAGTRMRLKAIQEDAIREIISIGIGRAAATLSDLIGTRIELGVPRITVRLLYADDALDHVASLDRTDMVIMQDFRGMLAGSSMLVLPYASGLRLAQLLADIVDPVDELDLEMTGILTEVGNIMINSVLTAMANFIGTRLVYSLPQFYQMRPVNMLKSHAGQGPGALLSANADFKVRSREIHGSLLVVMELRGLETILDAILKVCA